MSIESTLDFIKLAVAEDLGHHDATTRATVGAASMSSANIVAREPMVVCGLAVVATVFGSLDPEVEVNDGVDDGEEVPAGTILATVDGSTHALLIGERTALNFLQHLCGIATLTRRYVEAVEGTGARIIDTRKTLPGMRMLAKAAVRAGGGRNHRFGLDDGILIKDNHIQAVGSLSEAVRLAKSRGGYLLRVEVECDTLAQVDEALEAGADIILLDNMSLANLKKAVKKCKGRVQTEASGGVTLETVRAIAQTGVDFISVGAITHSAPAADIGLDFFDTDQNPDPPEWDMDFFATVDEEPTS